ncbi:MAG: hypothetical protein ACFE9L_04470 [Candidatus Hodarchaeota archaeon]
MKRKEKFCVFLTLGILFLITSVSLIVGYKPIMGTWVFEDDPNDGKNITDYIWSPDGTKIAYLMCPDDRALLYGACELWIADWQYGCLMNDRLIYTGVEWSSLADWQGDWILFMMRKEVTPSAYNSTYATRELWKIKADGTGLTQVTFTMTNGIRTVFWPGHYDNVGTVASGLFIPGTNLVVFSAHDGNGWYRLYVCNADGTDSWYHISYPYFSFTWTMSPTGNKLLYGHAGYWNYPTTLFSSNVDGTGRVLIKSNPHRVPPLVLSDGNTVIYRYIALPTVPPHLDGNIYAIDIDGSNDRTVLDDEYTNIPETYDPVDGQTLLMRSNRGDDGNMHIYTLNLAGTWLRALTAGPYNDDGAIYSPDGQYLMYRRLPEDYVPDGSNLPYPYDLVIVRVWRFKEYIWTRWSV